MRRLIVLDERWDSALTYFGFEIAKLIEGEKACAVIKGSPAEEMCKRENLKVFYVEDPRKHLLSPVNAFFSLFKVLKAFRPHTVITIRGDMLLFSSILKPMYGFKLVRVYGEAKGVRNNFFNRIIHNKFVDLSILTSEKLNSKILNRSKVTMIKGVVDTNKFNFSSEGREKIRREFKVKDEILLGLVGRLDRVKGHDVFIKGLSSLIGKGLNVKGLIIGEEKGISVKKLFALAERFNVRDRLIVLSERRGDIVDLMSAVDIGVVTSIGSEVIARVLLEFMSVGKPVVASKVGVIDEIVDESFGCTFERGDWEGFAKCVEEVLKKGISRLGKRAREVAVEQYSEDRFSDLVNSFIP